MHTYVHMALQSHITDSVEREIWWEEWGLEEGREGIKWAEEKLNREEVGLVVGSSLQLLWFMQPSPQQDWKSRFRDGENRERPFH